MLKLGIEFISARDAVIRSGQFVVTRPADSLDGDRLYGASRVVRNAARHSRCLAALRRTSPAEVGWLCVVGQRGSRAIILSLATCLGWSAAGAGDEGGDAASQQRRSTSFEPPFTQENTGTRDRRSEDPAEKVSSATRS